MIAKAIVNPIERGLVFIEEDFLSVANTEGVFFCDVSATKTDQTK